MTDGTISYLEPGEKSTEEALHIAAIYAYEHQIGSIVVASTRGYTAEKALRIFEGKNKNLVVVTHVHGFRQSDSNEFPPLLKKEMEEKGVHVLTAAHALGGINKLVENSMGDIIANTLRVFSQGTKVCIEIATEAADAGFVRTDEDILAVAGTGKGADTVLVLRPANSNKLFETRVRRILALPER